MGESIPLDTIKVYGVPSPQDNPARGKAPMPTYEEVTQRAGSLRSLTGLAEAEFQGLLPHFEQAFVTYVKQNPIQEVQGQLFGMSQSNANTWIHLERNLFESSYATRLNRGMGLYF